MFSLQEELSGCDTSKIDIKIKFEPTAFDSAEIYISNSNVKTFEDIMEEGPELVKLSDEWLRRNIRENMEKNADFWSELAKY